MELEILNMISNASINGYYDPSLGSIVVWFHNIDGEKEDLVAYLEDNMTWDLRKVVGEHSQLYDDREVIEINHELIEKFEKDSRFDTTVRNVLNQTIDHAMNEDKIISPKLEMMKIILDSNDYNSVRN
jgi:hypothetical protein